MLSGWYELDDDFDYNIINEISRLVTRKKYDEVDRILSGGNTIPGEVSSVLHSLRRTYSKCYSISGKTKTL
jgi:hypothetical protein